MDEKIDTIEAPSYHEVIRFSRPPEAVYAALTTAAGVSGWWMPTHGSGAEGGELELSMPNGPVVMRVDGARPHSQVRWTVMVCDFLSDWVGTRIVFTLSPDEHGGTTLEFRHEGLTRQLDCFDMCRQGWEYYLASLRDHVDTGVGRPGNRHGA